LADTARLLRIRGNAMQAAVPVGEGAMAAIIGLEQADVEAACAEAAAGGSVCQIANDNGGGQLVISGARAAVEKAAALCTDKGAKRALMLPVSAPFHSALMQPAADAMREALAGVAKHAPAVPVVANVTVSPLIDPDEIAARLVEQVTGRVRWRETVEWFGANGVTTLYEIGAGKVLSGLARRIDRNIATVNIGGPADIEAFVSE
ncbi:MAG: ACP S-malonyltransferase, partial [Aquamicrobium sp.]|nr:ACP S-malonyltransferase [Aquamicrobium sp.]